MTDPLMSMARFAALADAYGGAVARWPTAERENAYRLAAQPGARAILARAAQVDTVLDSWTVASPSTALRRSVLPPARRQSPQARLKLWWSGIGIAAALAGAAAGSVAAAAVAPADRAGDNATAFGDLAGQES